MLHNLRFSIEGLTEYLRSKKIICIGAGIQGIRAAFFMYDWGFGSQIICYADNSKQKQGKTVTCEDKEYPILSMEDAISLSDMQTIFVITSLYVKELTMQLEKHAEFRELYYVALDEVAENELLVSDYPSIVQEYNYPVIPKIIHYCWLGGQVPEKIQHNISKWKELCPDYEIIKWDETNYDFCKSKYAKQALDKKKWGFATDILRLDIIYKYGGIYLDTDIEMIKRPDELLYQDCFACIDASMTMNLGSGFGAQPGCTIIKDLLEYYDDLSFIREDGTIDNTTCNTHSFFVLRRYGVKINDKLQKIKEMNIYPMIMQGSCQYTKKKRITEKTYWIHHGNMSWL